MHAELYLVYEIEPYYIGINYEQMWNFARYNFVSLTNS